MSKKNVKEFMEYLNQTMQIFGDRINDEEVSNLFKMLFKMYSEMNGPDQELFNSKMHNGKKINTEYQFTEVIKKRKQPLWENNYSTSSISEVERLKISKEHLNKYRNSEKNTDDTIDRLKNLLRD